MKKMLMEYEGEIDKTMRDNTTVDSQMVDLISSTIG